MPTSPYTAAEITRRLGQADALEAELYAQRDPSLYLIPETYISRAAFAALTNLLYMPWNTIAIVAGSVVQSVMNSNWPCYDKIEANGNYTVTCQGMYSTNVRVIKIERVNGNHQIIYSFFSDDPSGPVGSTYIDNSEADVDDTLSVSGVPADSGAVGSRMQLAQSAAPVHDRIFYRSGAVTTDGYLTDNPSRIRSNMGSTPVIEPGDFVSSDGTFEFRVSIWNFPGQTSMKNGFIAWANDWTDSWYFLPREYVGCRAGILVRKKADPNADISAYADTMGEHLRYHKPGLVNYHEIPLLMTTGRFWNIESGTNAVLTAFGGYSCTVSPIAVNPGEVYRVAGRQGATEKVRIWAAVDSSYNIVEMGGHYRYTETDGINKCHEEIIRIPDGASWLLITSSNCYETPSLYRIDAAESGPLLGKTVAILGDSISTNGTTGPDANVPEMTITEADVGVSLSAYLTYYDVNAGLRLGGHTFTSDEIGTEVTFTPTSDDVGKVIGLPLNYNANTVTTWWEVARKELGFRPIPVCWSGASVTSHEAGTSTRKTAHAWHEAQIRKCGIRRPGSMDRIAPDVIILYRGTNDFSHSPYTLLTEDYFKGPNWEYPTTDAVPGGYGFLEGLSMTIGGLREAYPNARIILCTLNSFKRVGYSHFPTNNGINSLPEYNNAIRAAADFFGCGLIELDKCGITFENCYSEGYIVDSASIPTHPSDKGHYVMGKKAVADLKAQFGA